MAATAIPFRYALATNFVAPNGFTAQNATATEPSGTGVIDLLNPDLGIGVSGYRVPTYLNLVFFGTSADDQTFDARVYGYSPTLPTDLVTDTAIYIPQLLLDVSAILSAITFSDHAASTFLADTLTVNDGSADNGPWQALISPAENLVASILIHTRGCRYIKFDFDCNIPTAASANCMYRPIEF